VNLKRKSIYTALTKIFSIVISFVVQFFITPFILGSLGKELFGVYTIINKIQGYVSVVDLRPTAILRFKLAATQTRNNIQSSKEYIGSSLIISAILLPFIVLIGYLLSLGFGHYFKIDEQYMAVGKTSIIILSIFIGIKGFLGVPEAIIRGNNAEYKLFFIEPLRLIVYSLFVYVLINKGFGILGVITAIIIAGFFDFILKLVLQRKLYPLLKPVLPDKTKIKEFTGKGSWYLLSSLGSQVINTFDIMIIGVTIGAKAVTIYALSKMMIFRVSESFASVLGAITASIGHLISDQNTKKLIEIRYKLLRYNILFGSLIITYFVWFNSAFVSLWVDSSNYIGESGNALLCFVGMFTLLCLSNEIFINSLQLFKQKSRILLITVFIFLITAYFFSKQYGISGIAISLLISKSFQWICYEILLQKHIIIKESNVIRGNYKTIILLLFILILRLFVFKLDIYTWFEFIIQSLMFFALYILLVFLLILNQTEKKLIYHFFKTKFNA
jgi:O-antigen/teichoic acid export membrane protein